MHTIPLVPSSPPRRRNKRPSCPGRSRPSTCRTPRARPRGVVHKSCLPETQTRARALPKDSSCCCICLQSLDAPGVGRQALSCDHMLHEQCVTEMRRRGVSTDVRRAPHTPRGKTTIVYSKYDAGVVCHNCLMTELRDEVRPEPDHRQALERQIENVQKERRRQEGNRTIEEQERAYCTARSSL